MDEVIRRLERLRDERGDGVVADSEGALCVFLEGFKTRDGDPLPMIVRKTDGGYNYATSDLATIVHRVESLGATRIIYVVGLPQKQHFEMLFAAVRAVGFVSPDIRLEHLGFGSVLSAAGKPFKTREGGTVKLKDLLDEAVVRARAVIDQQQVDAEDDAADATRRPQRTFSEEQAVRIAETVGIAAVKYFDLSHALQSDYKFNLDHILAMDGNTAPYMLYAYARIRSIARKADVDLSALSTDQPMVLEHSAEIALAKKLLQFAEVVEVVSRELRPNVLTEYLYELARVFSRFYDKKLGVRVIDASPERVRMSRLRLCDLTARTLALGLSLLGIEMLEEM
jgi:arginyl-tRNA synthetase